MWNFEIQMYESTGVENLSEPNSVLGGQNILGVTPPSPPPPPPPSPCYIMTRSTAPLMRRYDTFPQGFSFELQPG